MTISSKRAEYVALASLIFSVLSFGIAFFVGRWSGFAPVSALSWLILSSALVWLVLVIQFHQRALAEQEKLDISQLAKDERASTIFQAKGERATMFAVAQRRLEILEKWFIPVFAAAITARSQLRAIVLHWSSDVRSPLTYSMFLCSMTGSVL